MTQKTQINNFNCQKKLALFPTAKTKLVQKTVLYTVEKLTLFIVSNITRYITQKNWLEFTREQSENQGTACIAMQILCRL